MMLLMPIYDITFRRICNPPVLIIRICNPIDCSLFADGKAQRFERITNPYSIFRRIANHAETQKLPKRRSKRNAETNKTQKQTKRRNKRNTEANETQRGRQTALQYAMFCAAKGRILPCKTWPFIRRKAAYCKTYRYKKRGR